jgi:hypothetical protein
MMKDGKKKTSERILRLVRTLLCTHPIVATHTSSHTPSLCQALENIKTRELAR